MGAHMRWPKYDAVCSYCGRSFKAKTRITTLCYEAGCVHNRLLDRYKKQQLARAKAREEKKKKEAESATIEG